MQNAFQSLSMWGANLGRNLSAFLQPLNQSNPPPVNRSTKVTSTPSPPSPSLCTPYQDKNQENNNNNNNSDSDNNNNNQAPNPYHFDNLDFSDLM